MQSVRMIAMALMVLFGGAALAAPPKVVKAFPANGAADVEPGEVVLRIEFDQPMRLGGRSVTQSSRGVFPQLLGQPKWEDARTFTWTMQLEPNTAYWLSINSPPRFVNFRSATGEPAEGYPIAFRTGAGKDAPPAGEAMVKANRAAIAKLRKAIDEDYSYRDLRKVDWEKQFETFSPKLAAARGPGEFASIAAKLLEEARDVHLTMRVGDRPVATWRRNVFPMMNFSLLQQAVPKWKRHHDFVYSGEFTDNTRYLCIASLPGNDAGFLTAIYDVIGEAAASNQPLIMDLRPNGGGDEITGQKIAGCFIEKPSVYAKHTMREGGKDLPVRQRVVPPNVGGPKFRGKVVVLTGPGVLSSCEALVLMMKQVPGCVTVGGTTGGSSGNPHRVELGNGTSVSIPRWKALRLDETCIEGEGIAPDVEVKGEAMDFRSRDPILAEGLKQARGAGEEKRG